MPVRSLRVPNEEWARWSGNAKYAGLSTSALIRRTMNQECDMLEAEARWQADDYKTEKAHAELKERANLYTGDWSY